MFFVIVTFAKDSIFANSFAIFCNNFWLVFAIEVFRLYVNEPVSQACSTNFLAVSFVSVYSWGSRPIAHSVKGITYKDNKRLRFRERKKERKKE